MAKIARAAVLVRDGGRCRVCGSARNLDVDHIVPVSKGGEPLFAIASVADIPNQTHCQMEAVIIAAKALSQKRAEEDSWEDQATAARAEPSKRSALRKVVRL